MTTVAERIGSPVEAVHRTAASSPSATAMTFVDYSGGGEGRIDRLTYGVLDARIRTLGAALRRTVPPGSRAAILCPPGADYVTSFLACLYAGAIGVPLYAPEAFRSGERLAVVMDDCRCEAVLTTTAARDAVAELRPAARAQIICVDRVGSDPGAAWAPLPADPAETAYLQYTSGSTRHPAGVRVSHRNMAVSAGQLAGRIGIGPDSKIVSWLPLFHDMGLVFGVLLPLLRTVPVVQMTPFAFVQQPLRWLRLLTEHGATHTLSPNFGLDLCVDRIPEERRAGLDLSRLRFLGNGAEPVRARSLDRFTEAYAPYGFRAIAHAPSYGLAEATLIVTGTEPDREPVVRSFDRAELGAGRVRTVAAAGEDSRTLVGCGSPAAQDVRIADPDTGREAEPDGVGEIWVRGDNVCAGYWGDRERTAEVFGASLGGEGGWLRTGDLGFFHEGSLFVAGRRKDLIIADGRNHHPVDIELTVEEESEAVRAGHVAAFGVDPGTGERLVIVAEVRPGFGGDLAGQHARLRRAVGVRHDLDVHDIVFVRRGTLPKTSSGKLRRASCREAYETGRLAAHRVR